MFKSSNTLTTTHSNPKQHIQIKQQIHIKQHTFAIKLHTQSVKDCSPTPSPTAAATPSQDLHLVYHNCTRATHNNSLVMNVNGSE